MAKRTPTEKPNATAMNSKTVPQPKDVPATQGLLRLVRTEFKSDILSLDSKMTAQFKQTDSKFDQLDAKIDQVDAKLTAQIKQLDAKIDQVDARLSAQIQRLDTKIEHLEAKMDSSFHNLKSDIAHIAILVEEQNSKNDIVLEALSGLFHRQERQEARMDRVEKLVESIATKLQR